MTAPPRVRCGGTGILPATRKSCSCSPGRRHPAVYNGRPGKGSNDAAQLRAAAAGRAAAVDRCRDLFGREWIILPNPAYGEWAKVAGRGERDRELLR